MLSRALPACLFAALASPAAAAAAEPPPASAVEPLTLPSALRLCEQEHPLLRELAYSVPLAEAQRDRALVHVLPQASVSAALQLNDREVVYDPGGGFDGSSLTEGFSSTYANLGYIYGKLFAAGVLAPEDCQEVAEINGFSDCAEMYSAFESGEFGGDGGSDDDGGESAAMEPIVITPRTQGFLSARLHWPLNPRVVPSLRAGRLGVDAARWTLEQARSDLLLAVFRAYAAAWASQEALAIAREGLATAEAHLRDTRLLEVAQMVTRDNVLRAELELERQRRQVGDGESALRQARRTLAQAMGVQGDDGGELAALPDVGAALRAPEPAVIGEAPTRPESRAAAAQSAMARELATDAALQFLPQFAVSAQWNWQAPAAGFDGRSGSGNLGASLSLPLLDGGLLIQGLREAKARRLQAEAHERTLGSRVRTELHNAWDSLETARRAVPLTERERGLAAEALRLVQIRFAAGTARQVEVLDAVTALRQSELALLRSQLAREQAAAEYLAASGDWLGWAATPAPAAGP